MGMLTQLKNTFSRSRMSMSTSVPITKPKPVARPKAKIAVKTVKAKSAPKAVKVAPVKKPALVVAQGEECFWSHDGKILASHRDLKAALETMSPESYKHHTDKRNDFANWVELVLLDKACAGDLRKAKTQKAAIAVMTKKLS